MTVSRSKSLFIITFIFIILALLLSVPSTLLAQTDEEAADTEIQEPEPETLEFDISYGEVTDFGAKGTTFEFDVTVTFDGKEEKYFEVIKENPPGWEMVVNPGTLSTEVPMILLKSGSPQDLKVKCTTLVNQEPGEYVFKLTLRSAMEGDDLENSAEFTGIVKPNGELRLVTPNERLNTEIRAGKENVYKILVQNVGTAPVEDITLSSSGEPEGWQVELEDNIDIVEVGEEVEVDVTIIPPERTIAGDYNINFTASSEEDNDSLEIRTIVETPLIWKIVGIGLIAVVIAGIAVIFERLGRR